MFVHFHMKELEELKHTLGLEVEISNDGIILCQLKNAQDLLGKYDFLDCKPISNPIENSKLYSIEGKNL